MKNLIYILFLFAAFVKAQNPTVPQGISYQGVARDVTGTVLANTTIAVKFDIRNLSTASIVYSESYSGAFGNGLSTNAFGIFTAIIGSQNTTSFQGINWASAAHQIDVYIDVANGTSFSLLGTQNFQSVPYAFHSADGVFWKGRSSVIPAGAVKGSVYRDPIGGATYYLNNTGIWDTLAYSGGGSLPSATINQTIYHNGTGWSATNKFNIDAGYKLVIGKSFSDASAVIDIADSLHGILIPRMSFAKRIGIASPADGLLVYQTNENILATSPKGFYYYDAAGVTPGWRWVAPYNNFTSPWLRNTIGANDHVALVTQNDYVNIGLPLGVASQEKFHLHNATGDAFMELSTASGSGNVGFVFGEASNWSKGVLIFDNFSNSLQYKLLSQRLLMIEGGSKATHIGLMPLGASSISALNVYDSVQNGSLKPIMRILNSIPAFGVPSSIFLGDIAGNGLNISHRRNPISTISFDGPNLAQTFHSFDANGKYFPGSDGTAGQSFIQGGATGNDDLIMAASTNGNIVNQGYTKLGAQASQYPAIQVIEFNGTLPTTAGGSTAISLSSYVSNPDQILSVQLFVQTANRTVPPSFNMFPGYEYDYEILPTIPTIIVWASTSNSGLVLNQPFRVLVTIKK